MFVSPDLQEIEDQTLPNVVTTICYLYVLLYNNIILKTIDFACIICILHRGSSKTILLASTRATTTS